MVAPALWALGTRRLDVARADARRSGSRGRRGRRGARLPPARDLGGRPGADSARDAATEAAGRRGRHPRGASAGRRRACGSATSTLRVRHPPPADWERQRVRNDDSMVIELDYGDVSVVLAGDIGREVEAGLAPRFAPAAPPRAEGPAPRELDVELARIPAALRPRVAILSAGTSTKVNDEVLRRYGAIGATLYRTDVDGAVTLDTDGRRRDGDHLHGRDARSSRNEHESGMESAACGSRACDSVRGSGDRSDEPAPTSDRGVRRHRSGASCTSRAASRVRPP